MEIGIAESDDEIIECFEVLSQLRPQLKRETFVALIRKLMHSHGYRLVFLRNSGIKSVMGVRIGMWLHTGKYLEIEDLITSSNDRSNGYGEHLLEWAKQYAKLNECGQVRLVSGVAREQAHQFYQRNGMSFEAKYFSINV